MDRNNHCISPKDLYARLGCEAAPIVVDVRRDADFAGPKRLWPMRFIALRMLLNCGEPICRAGARSIPGAARYRTKPTTGLRGRRERKNGDRNHKTFLGAELIAPWTGVSVTRFDSITIAPPSRSAPQW
jgi:hypothetical protein